MPVRFCIGSGLCYELITRSGESYQMYVFVCDLETSTIKGPRPPLGCCARKKKYPKKPTLSHLTLRRLMSYIYGAPILDVSRSHTTTQHSRWDSFGRVISSSQRPLPDNTRHSQQTNIHAPGGIRTQDLSRQAAFGRSPAEILGSKPTGGIDICLL